MESITISDIVDLSGVGRTTYFRNFSSKQEMISFRLVLYWKRWCDEQSLVERKNFLLDNALSFFKFNYSIRDVLSVLYERNLQSTVYDAFNMEMIPEDTNDAFQCYKSRFYAYGLFGLLDQWIKRDFSDSPEDMARHIVDILHFT